MKAYSTIFLLSLFMPLSSYALTANDAMLHALCSYNGPRVFLCSYPRSGNTWLRYCLESLTQRPTFSRVGFHDPKQQPLACHSSIHIDLTKPPLEKIHKPEEMGAYDATIDKLILIIRNPKETLCRAGHRQITYDLLKGRDMGKGYTPVLYFKNIQIYDAWNTDNRLLIYYEDLLQNPREQLTRVLNFLGEPTIGLDSFMQQYSFHTQQCLKLYKTSASGGQDLLFHSKKITPEFRRTMDAWIAQLYPALWNQYLQGRYAEEILDYANIAII